MEFDFSGHMETPGNMLHSHWLCMFRHDIWFVFVQTLLRHGANPDLRDEDGKTPLDKARERGHSEVVAILQSPG